MAPVALPTMNIYSFWIAWFRSGSNLIVSVNQSFYARSVFVLMRLFWSEWKEVYGFLNCQSLSYTLVWTSLRSAEEQLVFHENDSSVINSVLGFYVVASLGFNLVFFRRSSECISAVPPASPRFIPSIAARVQATHCWIWCNMDYQDYTNLRSPCQLKCTRSLKQRVM